LELAVKFESKPRRILDVTNSLPYTLGYRICYTWRENQQF